MTGLAVEVDLLTPFLSTSGKAHDQSADELAEALVTARKLRQRAAGRVRQIGAENESRRLIRDANRQLAIHPSTPVDSRARMIARRSRSCSTAC